jgi:hypothetical protein
MRIKPATCLAAFVVGLSFVSGATFEGLTSQDEGGDRAVNAAPVAGWLKNDANAVLETLRPDAMPIPQGRPPI